MMDKSVLKSTAGGRKTSSLMKLSSRCRACRVERGARGSRTRLRASQATTRSTSRLSPAPPKTRGEYASDKRSYVEEYVVSDCETIEEGNVVSPVIITKIVESLAIGHFQKLSGDSSDVPRSKEMKELDLTFMLSRITFDFSELPQSDHQVEAETCFKPQKVSFKRDFAIRNKSTGATVAAVTSTYVLVNFKTRKLSIAPKEMVDLYKDFSTKDTSRLGLVLPRKSKLGSFTSEEAQLTKTFTVEESDIDLNGHVGATVYIHWILDSSESASLETLKTLDIEYKQECFLGEKIQCYIQTSVTEEGKKEISHLIQTEEGNILLRAKSVWLENKTN